MLFHISEEPGIARFECRCLDAVAGYFVSRVPVVPVGVEVFEDPLFELLRRGAELRVLHSLWALRDAVLASSLQFSFIRMRNALPGPAGTSGPFQPMANVRSARSSQP